MSRPKLTRKHSCNHCLTVHDTPGAQEVWETDTGMFQVQCVTCGSRGPEKPKEKEAWIGWAVLNGVEVGK